MTVLDRFLHGLRTRVRERHVPTLLGLGLSILVALALMLQAWVLPSVVRAKLAQRTASLGWQVDIASVSAGLLSTTLHDVRAARVEDGRRVAQFSRVEVSGGAFGSAADEVVLHGARVELRVSDLKELVQSLRASGAGSEAAQAPRGASRAFRASDLHVRVDDEEGALVAAQGIELERAPSGLVTYAAERVQVGAEPYETAELRDLRGAFVRGPQGLELQHLDIRHGRMRWAASTAETAERRLIPRLRRFRAELRGGELLLRGRSPRPASCGRATRT